MDIKVFILLTVTIHCYTSCGAALRRTPKVYNALITTDENLTSSRAYPVIQPTIHQSGTAQYPFGPFNPYGFYTPPVVRFGQPIAPGLIPKGQFPYFTPNMNLSPNIIPKPFNGYPQIPEESQKPSSTPPTPTKPDEAKIETEPQPSSYLPMEESQPEQMPTQKLPIPLNEFGLPPSLIPLSQFPNRNNQPIHLPTYGFNQYPVLYDPITGYREQYLPPYDYVSSPPYAQKRPSFNHQQVPHQTPSAASTPKPTLNQTTPPNEQEQTEQNAPNEEEQTSVSPDFESIKNGSKNKNNDIPDVPPPPIPTSNKSKET